MSVTIQFLINLEPSQYSTIVSQLKSTQFDVSSLTSRGDNIPIPCQLFCSRQFVDWPEVVYEQNNMHGIQGVKNIIIFRHDVIKDKQKWYRHWIIPMLIATAVNVISLLLLVYKLKPDSTLFEYLIITIVPPLLSLGSAVGIKSQSQ